MKYFLYMSTLKVNMLFEQIPLSIKKRVAAELKIDLKVFSATFKEASTSETTISRLQLVIKSLESADEIGDLWNPKEYFAGELNMGWGALGPASSDASMVLFGGSLADKRFVGLIGSKAHMLGEVSKSVHTGYAQPGYFRYLAEAIKIPDWKVSSVTKGTLFAIGELVINKEDAERVEFVAKTFLSEQGLLLGSPLYVAFAKREKEKELFSQFS